MTFHAGSGVPRKTLHRVTRPFTSLPMQVTQEDGGRLNAFAKEPRMVLMEKGETSSANRSLLLGGLVLVVLLIAVAAGIS